MLHTKSAREPVDNKTNEFELDPFAGSLLPPDRRPPASRRTTVWRRRCRKSLYISEDGNAKWISPGNRLRGLQEHCVGAGHELRLALRYQNRKIKATEERGVMRRMRRTPPFRTPGRF
jgi:hypothetical protein